MRAAKKHGSPLGYSVFQKVLNGRGLDGAFETPQALTLSDIRSPGNLSQVQVFVEMFMDKAYHFLDTHIIRIRNWFPRIHCMGIVHVKGTADTGQFFADHELVSQWFAGKCIKGSGEDGSGISLSGVSGKKVKRTGSQKSCTEEAVPHTSWKIRNLARRLPKEDEIPGSGVRKGALRRQNAVYWN